MSGSGTLDEASEASAVAATRALSEGDEAESGRLGAGASGLGSRFSAGANIGRYTVVGQLGAGAMGQVFAAYDPELDRKVAVKVLQSASASLNDRVRLQREAQALAQLNHPNVVSVHDVGTHGEDLFIAMEFVEGMTLRKWMGLADAKKARPYEEVLRVFVQAGRGLAAAHAQGIIHRDFKPDNVMLRHDGQVLVMDFGLARSSGGADTRDEATSPSEGLEMEELPDMGSKELAILRTPMTRTGAVMGTPAYMGPEQFAGHDVTALSDQFSFCVALYEALSGQRPFASDSMEGLQKAVSSGEARALPRESLPAWLRAAVHRGLSREPSRRFSSMEELLAALEAGESAARRRRRAFVAAGVLALAAGAWAIQRGVHANKVAACEAEADGVAQLWNPERRQALRHALALVPVSFAQAAADACVGYLDTQSAAIRAAQRELCVATKVEGTQSQDFYERASWCLDERRFQLDSLVSQIIRAEPTPALAKRGFDTAASLDPVDACTDPVRLGRQPPPPTAGEREAVGKLRNRLAQLRVAHYVDAYPEALAQARTLLADAEAQGWAPLVAATRVRLAKLHTNMGDYEDSATQGEKAYFEAVECGAYGTAALAATDLVYTMNMDLSRPKEALRWAKLAQTALKDAGIPEDSLEQSTLQSALASTHAVLGDLDEAVRLETLSLELSRARLGDAHPDIGAGYLALGNHHYRKGDIDGAEALWSKSASVLESAFGKLHRDVAAPIGNLAFVYNQRGEFEKAESLRQRELEIVIASKGPDHPAVGQVLLNLGALEIDRGRHEVAKEHLERALAIFEASYEGEHSDIADTLGNLGMVRLKMGDEAGLENYEQALAMNERLLGSDSPQLIAPLGNLALKYRERQRLDEAEALAKRAVALVERHKGPDDSQLGYALDTLAEIARERGQGAEALVYARRSLSVREAGDVTPDLVAESQFTLAKLLWELPPTKGGDRSQALELANSAAQGYRKAEGKAEAEAQVREWLAERL